MPGLKLLPEFRAKISQEYLTRHTLLTTLSPDMEYTTALFKDNGLVCIMSILPCCQASMKMTGEAS